MPNQLTVVSERRGLRYRALRYRVALSGLYVQATRLQDVGEVLKLENALNPYNIPQAFWGNEGPSPTGGTVINPPKGYPSKILPGATVGHFLLQMFSGVLTELAAGAYDAAVIADQDIYIEFDGASYK